MRCGPYLLDFSHTLIMGALNVTPDSFSDGGQFLDPESAVQRAKQMVEEGADIIDIGGESTKPGSDPIPAAEELRRVKPVVERLVRDINVPLSVDTYKPEVAEECLEAGAHIINDITGLRDKNMIRIALRHEAPVVVMHMRGTPKTMQQDICYNDLVADIKAFLAERVGEARSAGIEDVIVDPGVGFGKTTRHNLKILQRLADFKFLGCPVLIGPSRKTFIGDITGRLIHQRLEATLSAISIAIWNGADIVRAHDVKECKIAVRLVDAIKTA